MARTIQLEHFGDGIRNPYGNNADHKLWMFYENDFTEPGDRGQLWIGPRAARQGKNGLGATVIAKNVYLYFYPYSQKDQTWHYLREHVEQGAWLPNTFERLSYWVQTPQGLGTRKDGGFNHHTSWFTRHRDAPTTEAESHNGKWYAYANLFPGCWNYVSVDFCHPHHQRNQETREWGLRRTPSGQDNEPFMLDQTTAFYIDPKGALRWLSAAYYFDSFLLETIPKDEPIAALYGLVVAHDPDKELLYMSWSKRRDTTGQTFTVWAGREYLTLGDLRQAAPVLDRVRGVTEGDYNAVQCMVPCPVKEGTLHIAIRADGEGGYRRAKIELQASDQPIDLERLPNTP